MRWRYFIRKYSAAENFCFASSMKPLTNNAGLMKPSANIYRGSSQVLNLKNIRKLLALYILVDSK